MSRFNTFFRRGRTLRLTSLSVLLLLALAVPANAQRNVLTYEPEAVSILDMPVNFGGAPVVLLPSNARRPAAADQANRPWLSPVVPLNRANSIAQLRRSVRAEQRALQRLSQNELERRANSGQRSAQAALSESYAREAAMLGFAPAAANAALSDAIRYYNLAAQRGFPGAPSLDSAGIRIFPIRAQR